MITDKLITLVSVCLTGLVPFIHDLIQNLIVARNGRLEQRRKEMMSTIDAYTSSAGKILMHKSLESMNDYSSSVGPVFKYATESERDKIKELNGRILARYYDETSNALYYEICESLSDKLLVQVGKNRNTHECSIVKKDK